MVYKKGYLPAREKMKYSKLHTSVVNCFAHACFNLTEKDLKELNPYMPELHDFFCNFDNCGVGNYIKKATEKIEKVGLKFEKSSLEEKIKENQWKVAYYVMHDEFLGNDLHFMIQCKDGKWTSKVGLMSKIEVYEKLPETYHEDYDLVGIYKITNPYYKLEDEENMEM